MNKKLYFGGGSRERKKTKFVSNFVSVRRFLPIGLTILISVLIIITVVKAGTIISQSASASEGELLQFTSAGHVLGFGKDGVIIASARHMLKINFLNSRAVAPEADDTISQKNNTDKASPLGRVTYKNVWDGVTVVYEASGTSVMKSTYYIDATKDGVPVDRIRLGYNRPVQINDKGNLVISYEDGTMTEAAPVAWQEKEGVKKPVLVSYVLNGEREVGFSLGDYISGIPVVIDPDITWNTFLGDSGLDAVYGIAVDGGNGNVYVVGHSSATWGAPVRTYTSGDEAFVAKLDSSGALTWNTFLGTTGNDYGRGIAVDSSNGNVYVTGKSDATWGSPVRAFTSGTDAFAAKLDSSGSLLWNTFLGALVSNDEGRAIAVDGGNGNVYVTGYGTSTWGAPVRAYTGNFDVFAAKLNLNGALTWNTFLGGANADRCNGIAVDGSNGNVYVGGYSAATWGVPVRAYTSGNDGFAAKLNLNGALTWNTFFGGGGDDRVNAIAVDGNNGNIYVDGQSNATWGTPVRAHSGSTDGFAAKLNLNGALTWNTFLGGSGIDYGYAIAVDGSNGNVYVTGFSNATWGAPVRAFTSGYDGFATKLNSGGNLTWNTFQGTSGDDNSWAIAVDGSNGNVYVGGYGVATWGVPVRAYYGSGQDAFVAKLDYRISPTLSVTNSPVTYNAAPQAATVSGSVPGVVSSILTGGAATQTNVGTYAVTANFVPNDIINYSSLTAASAGNFVISVANQTITFDPLPNKSFGDSDFIVSATASSGLTVSFTSQTPGICTVSTATVHLVAVGTCTIRALQAGNSNYNAALNVDQSFNVIQAATKFVILPPSNGTTGAPVTVTVQAEKADNSIDTNYQQDVTLNVTGSATGAGLVNIINGVGTIDISDEVAETVNLTLSDTQSTGLNFSSTQDVVFAPGPLFQYTINNPGNTTAGARSAYTVTRKDQFGNVVTGGAGAVFLYTTSTTGFGAFYNAATDGNIMTSVTIADGSSTSNFWYQEGKVGTYSITVSDNGMGSDGTDGVDDASDPITISSGPTTVLLLNDPGDMSVNTRLGYTVTRKDSFGNLATNGSEIYYLYSTSTGNKLFYDAGISGNVITNVTIGSGVSSANFWYFDDTSGTWTINVSDNSSNTDGVAGITDGTDSVLVNTIPVTPTKIIILNPNDSTAGTATPVTIKVVDDSNNIDTLFNSSVTLNTTGSALGGGIIPIASGIGIVNINDNTAETVNLSLTDSGSTGLDTSSVQDVVFATGPVAQFTLNNPGDGVAGNRFNYTVTRQDQFGNLVTSGINTVYLYTNSSGTQGKFYDSPSGGNIIISVDIGLGQSSASFYYQEGTAGDWTVAASDNNTTSDNAGITDANDTISIAPAATNIFILNDPGDMSVNTRLGYTVIRKDVFGNLVTNGSQNVYLYSTSTSANKAFFSGATGGVAVTSVTIPNGASQIHFWYFDDTAGSSVINASDNLSNSDGGNGIIDGSDTVAVSTIPIVATKLVINSQASALVGDTVTVTINAEDDNGNIDVTFTGNVTLHATGSVTGEGLVHLVHGVGTKNISDAVSETVTFSLQDTANTGLNVNSTANIIFSSVVVPSSSGIGVGTLEPTFAIKFSGKAPLGSLINVLGIPEGGNLSQAVSLDQDIAKQNGSFSLGLNNPDAKSGFYLVTLTDKNNVPGQVKFFPNLPDVASLNNIVFAPTITLLRSEIRQPDFLSISGYTGAGSTIEAQFDGKKMAKETTIAGADGSYKFLVSTSNLELGKHSVRVRSKTNGKATDFSLTISFTLSNLFRPQVDLNHDGVVDVRDLNIFNYDWASTDPNIRSIIDFNGDGKVDLQDLSIFTQALKR